MSRPGIQRATEFASTFSMRTPLFMAPMAGACPAPLAAAVSNAGGMGACGALLMSPDAIGKWVSEFRQLSTVPLQLNMWIPDPAPIRDQSHEKRVAAFLENFGPEVSAEAADRPAQDFDAQCAAMLDSRPDVISSIMGVYEPPFVKRMKADGVRWFVTVTTVAEALEAEAAGADAVVAQGMEAGGHRGAFKAQDAETALVGLFSLLPAVVDAVSIPVIATGGIADPRGIVAALMLGASGVQIGTGLLRTPEANTNPAWAKAIGEARPEDTVPTRAFSGRLGRAIRSSYVEAANAPTAPAPAPYPIQRALTQAMRDEAGKAKDIDRMQAWAGQSGALARTDAAATLVETLWTESCALLKA